MLYDGSLQISQTFSIYFGTLDVRHPPLSWALRNSEHLIDSYNESKRLKERYLRFDVAELSKAAASSIGMKSDDVRSINKLAEGGFNRVFEVTMKDGFQIIARLPYPLTQPKRFAVASEVATMDLVRSHGAPAPQIYGYCTNADNPVGAEYILMERAKGKSLGDVWFTLSPKERIKVLSGIAEQEANLFSLDLTVIDLTGLVA